MRKVQNYTSPEVEVVEMIAEGVICASGDNVEITVPDPWAGNIEKEF